MPRLGDVLASKYRLEQLLGSGGMGHVYRATNEDIGRVVAIKVLRSEHAQNPQYVERFLREARAANLVRHPNVVDVLDIGRDGEGTPFLVQELLQGQDLLAYVQSHGGKLGLGELAELIVPVVDAVGLAHAQGVVHRDIKPENVFLAEVGGRVVPKLLDFGISKIRASIRTTEVGTMMGTPAYMSPEVVQGQEAEPRSDVWALGIMLFELVAGRYPFTETDAPALFVQVVTKDMPRLVDLVPDVPIDLSRIVERCLRRQAGGRYATAAELAEDLRSVLAGGPLEPTQRNVVAAAPVAAPVLAIPDLALPAAPAKVASPTRPGFEELERAAPLRGGAETGVATAVPGAAPGELELPPPPDLDVQLDRPAPAASQSRIPQVAGYQEHGVYEGYEPRHGASRPVSPPPIGWAPPPRSGAEDMGALAAIAAVGLTTVITTAALTTFARFADGLAVLAFFTRADASTNLLVQAVLALAALGLAVRFVLAGFRAWQNLGGKAGALVQSALGGAFFFLAIELARAAF